MFGKPSRPAPSHATRIDITGSQTPLAKYIAGSMKLRGYYRGRKYVARVRRDGSIRFGGKIYNSPSAAGLAVRKRSTNGWAFWQYERAPGDWVKLDKLRKS